jgi:glucose/galactose transporter
MALPSSWVLKKTGLKGGMSLGLLIMAIGSLIFIPAANTRTYGLFLLGLFIQGTGLTILQTASNPYAIILGPIESAAKRISIMGICNKVAGAIGAFIFGVIILKNIDPLKEKLLSITDSTEKIFLLNDMASKVIMPYIVMTMALILLAALVKYSSLPDIDTDKDETHLNKSVVNKTGIFQFPHLLLGFLAIFFYVGAEVISVDTIILYGQSHGIAMEEARIFSSYTMVAMVIGYILGIILIPKFIKQDKALLVSAVLGITFSLSAIFTLGFTSVLFIAFLGFANAVMWPAIWPLAIQGLGKFTKIGSAILIMGIIGGATLPLLYGRLADIPCIGSQQAYWILIPCYLFIFYYAIKGHKIRI